MCELSESDKAAISQYQIMDALDADGNRVGELCKIKLHNKMSALDKIARHLGFYGVERKSPESGVGSPESGVWSPESGVVSGESGVGSPESGVVRGEFGVVSPESGVLGGELASDDGVVETVPEAGVLHQGAQLEYLEAEHGNITDKTGLSDRNEVMMFADEVTAGVEKILTLSPLYGDGYGVTIDLPGMANEPIVGDGLLIAAG